LGTVMPYLGRSVSSAAAPFRRIFQRKLL
jgi:hypothetical protein